MSEKEYPKSAFRFAAPVEIVESENAPPEVRMVARSEKSIDHWYWGKVAHDNSGAKFKNAIPLDYCHDDKEIIGFAKSENITVSETGSLELVGSITPFSEGDRASEILAKSKMGVPYEASINFAGDGIKIEEISKGESTEVNGYTFEGPGVVIREWPLRGVAVCPYGADGNTASEFNLSDVVSVTVLEKVIMDTDKKEEVAELVEATPEKELAVEPVQDPRAEAKKFFEAFGEKAGSYLAQDLSFEDALAKFATQLQDELEQAKAKILHLESSSAEALPAELEDDKPAKAAGFASRFNVPSSN